jgi:hypothetical protein
VKICVNHYFPIPEFVVDTKHRPNLDLVKCCPHSPMTVLDFEFETALLDVSGCYDCGDFPCMIDKAHFACNPYIGPIATSIATRKEM